MTVFVPADAPEAAQAIRAAAEIDGPVYIRLGRSKIDVIHDDSYRFVPGKIQVEASGTDVTIAACGIMVAKALEAKEILREQGIDAAVLNVSTIKRWIRKPSLIMQRRRVPSSPAKNIPSYGGLGSVIARP